jgi:hypothetical protein
MKKLWTHQLDAVKKLQNGSVLVGGTGAGKSLVALTYFYEKELGGSIDPPKLPTESINLYVITTPKKRDSGDWLFEAIPFLLSSKPELNPVGATITVDSWNNIQNYIKVKNAFFIFDEQKTMGYSVWAKAFIKITKGNRWIMLSATPADRWIDLLAVFIANGHYKNKSDFVDKHVVFEPHSKYPRIRSYMNVSKLQRLKDEIFVIMPFRRKSEKTVSDVLVDYDKEALEHLVKAKWNPWYNRPIRNLSEFAHSARRIVNSHPSRIERLQDIHTKCNKLIVFYNFDYELDIMLKGFTHTTVAQLNGYRHDELPSTNDWVYLVQYMSGNEAWECFSTNHMAFYSLNYSYRISTQAMGRIDRLTTPYNNLYYYRLLSRSFVDNLIVKAYKSKKNFNQNTLKVFFNN